MTFKSLYIEQHLSQESALAHYVPGSPQKAFGSLNAYTFPVSVEAWARKWGHAISYVDNAWARLALDAPALRQFLVIGSSTEPDIETLIEAVEDGHWYVINEEEF